MRRTFAAALLAALIGVAAGPGAAAQSDDVQRKLEEFDRRLKELEARQAQEKSEAKTESGAESKDEMTVQVEELRRQLDILAEEIEKIRSGEEEVELSPDRAKSLGLGPAAASVYRKKRGVSIAGYGEVLYQNFDGSNEAGTPTGAISNFDALRAIVYFGHRFNDKFVFNSEIEVEHGDEIGLEFAYIDYLASPHFNLRGGHLLIPMGLVNELHEPNVFLGARRSETESRIIPSTWHENGVGFYGSAGPLNYRAYMVNGLDASGFSAGGLRGGRQGGSRAKAADLAFVGRLDVTPSPGMFFGGSLYVGDSGQNQYNLNGRNLDVRTTIGEVHGQVQARGFDVRGLYARANVGDAAELSQVLQLDAGSPVAETLEGGFLQFGYNLLSQTSERAQLTPYYRWEKVNTQAGVPAGFLADPAFNRTYHTLGLELKPIYNVVLKADYQWLSNDAESGVNQFNVALGYSF